jgi:hypothetical protein
VVCLSLLYQDSIALLSFIYCYFARSSSGQAQSIRKLHSRLGEYRSAVGLDTDQTAYLKTAAAPALGDESLSESDVSSSHRETESLSQSTIDAMPIGSSSSSSPQHWAPLQEGAQGADPLHNVHAHGRETSAVTSLAYDACTQTNTVGK